MLSNPIWDLTSSGKIWPAHDFDTPRYSALTADTGCEVAVIGGGVTGALVADSLVRDGLDVVLVDKGEIGGGSTSASTALLLYEIDVDLVDLIEMVGERHAVRAYELCRAAIHRIEALCRELEAECGDRCGFAWKPSWYLTSTDDDERQLWRERDARLRYGFQVELLGRAAIEARSSFSRAAALVTDEAAQVDVYRFTHRLLVRNLARGLRVFGGTDITRYENHSAGVILHTADGCRINARRVVFATGYDAAQILKRPVVQLSSTYVAISNPIDRFEGWPDTCLIWETARPYTYLRTTEDGRAMIGGEDEPFADPSRRDSLLIEKTALLVERFRAMFPRIPFEVESSYAGTFGKTSDGLAYIGAVSEFPHGYFALGFGGNGITFSIVAADIVRDMIRGIENADAAIFRFGRQSFQNSS